jgi:hypothetical protein
VPESIPDSRSFLSPLFEQNSARFKDSREQPNRDHVLRNSADAEFIQLACEAFKPYIQVPKYENQYGGFAAKVAGQSVTAPRIA